MNSTPQSFADRPKTEWKPAESYLDLRRVKSSDLFAGETEIGIDHAGSLYRLKITRQGKLILNK
jgi:hemin uptake protein HemP